MIKRFLQDLIIWLKVDLRLSTHFKAIRERLHHDITARNGLFVENFRGYFFARFPYDINPEEPPAILGIKKLLNALAEAEEGAREIELIDIREELPARDMISGAIFKLSKNISHLHHAIILLGESYPELREVLSSYVQPLLDTIPKVQHELQKKTKSLPELAGSLIGAHVADLPTEPSLATKHTEQFFHFLFDLPKYFERLNQLMGEPPSTVFESEAWEQHASERAKHISEHLRLIAQYRNAGTIAHLPHYFRSLEALSRHSADLLTATDHLTKESYEQAIEKLNLIREEIAKIVSDFEAAEEQFGIKPHIKAPLLRQLETFYKKLAQHVNLIASKSQDLHKVNRLINTLGGPVLYFFGAQRSQIHHPLTPDTGIEVLQDATFLQKLADDRVIRRYRYQAIAEDQRAIEAARDFFDTIEALMQQESTVTHVNQLSTAVKEDLISRYRLVQPYLAKHNPQLDHRIVDGLRAPTPTATFTKAVGGLIGSISKSVVQFLARQENVSELQMILSAKEGVMRAIRQEQNQAQLTLNIAQEMKALRRPPVVRETILPAEVLQFTVPDFFLETPIFYTSFDNVQVAIEERRLEAIVAENESYRDQCRVLLESVKQAKQCTREFYDELAREPGIALVDLPEETKERLRKAYQYMQPHMMRLNPSVNSRLVNALNRQSGRRDRLTLVELPTLLHFNEYFDSTIQELQEKEASFTANIIASTKDKEQRLTRASSPHKSSNLYGHLVELQLAKKLSHFIQDTLKNHLQAQLNEDIFKELHFNIMPKGEWSLGFIHPTLLIIPQYQLSLHADKAQAVKLYQSFIDTLMNLEKALRDLETIPLHVDSEVNTLQTFILSFVARAVNTFAYFNQFTHLPVFAELQHEWDAVIEPLKVFPYVQQLQSMLSPVEEPALVEPFNAKAAWKAQMAVVRQALKHEPYPEEEPAVVPTSATPATAASMVSPEALPDPLDVLAERFFRLPNILAHLTHESNLRWDEAQIHAKATHLVASLKHIGLNAASLDQLITTIDNVMQRFTDLTTGGRLLLTRDIEQLRYDIYVTLLRASDASELTLGLKPNVLSQHLMPSLDSFFDSLIENLPLGREEYLQLLDNEKILLARQRHIKDMTEAARTNSTTVRYEKKWFELFEGIVFPRIESMVIPKEEDEVPEEEIRNLFFSAYEHLQPLLVTLDQRFNCTKYLRKLRTVDDFKNAMQEILAMKDALDIYIQSLNPELSVLRFAMHYNAVEEQLKNEPQALRLRIQKYTQTIYKKHLDRIKQKLCSADGEYALGQALGSLFFDFIAKEMFTPVKARLLADLVKDDSSMLEKEQECYNLRLFHLLKKYYLCQQFVAKYTTSTSQAGTVYRELATALEGFARLSGLPRKLPEVDVFLAMEASIDSITIILPLVPIEQVLKKAQTYLTERFRGNEALKQEKLRVIGHMLAMIEQAEVSADERLNNVRRYLETSQCKTILLQHASWKFIHLIKKLWFWVTGKKLEEANLIDEMDTAVAQSRVQMQNALRVGAERVLPTPEVAEPHETPDSGDGMSVSSDDGIPEISASSSDGDEFKECGVVAVVEEDEDTEDLAAGRTNTRRNPK